MCNSFAITSEQTLNDYLSQLKNNKENQKGKSSISSKSRQRSKYESKSKTHAKQAKIDLWKEQAKHLRLGSNSATGNSSLIKFGKTPGSCTNSVYKQMKPFR